MPSNQNRPFRVRDAGAEGAAAVAKLLKDSGIPSALWGANAAAYHGGGLCPLDIELVVNDAHQQRAFGVLTAHGVLPAIPDDSESTLPIDYALWRQQAPSYRYRDRRRVRICSHLYKLPPSGDWLEDSLLPYIILYSAETVGLPSLPPFPHTKLPRLVGSRQSYVLAPALHSPRMSLSKFGTKGEVLTTAFAALVESEMNVLLWHADYLSPAWGQHMAQLSELLRSRSVVNGPDGLPDLVDSRLSTFANWIQLDFRGEADPEDLADLKDVEIRRKAGANLDPHHCDSFSSELSF
ncbi:hypothetical protein HRG_002277 [Hirsutella rhossiliensis]|uniref:Uncharacterized protein n=1 Tax=Hirsutella rhossiliensis TaxID=111463 RepID=A0A9P8N392_9HYPO|nr:uncharacterized protein HRG_02277 [Hirsutella rhossiliensis]KAH0966868.1 hypothetical protein HRG_02277 [Hirsutella rhossiliensis]